MCGKCLQRQHTEECASAFVCVATFICKITLWQTCAFSKSCQKDKIRDTKLPVALISTSNVSEHPQGTSDSSTIPASLQGTLHLVQNFPFQMTYRLFDKEIIRFCSSQSHDKRSCFGINYLHWRERRQSTWRVRGVSMVVWNKSHLSIIFSCWEIIIII